MVLGSARKPLPDVASAKKGGLMGIQDRDWYRDAQREREAREDRAPDPQYFPKQFRGSRYKAASARPPSRPRHWHPVLSALAWVSILAFLCGLFKIFYH